MQTFDNKIACTKRVRLQVAGLFFSELEIIKTVRVSLCVIYWLIWNVKFAGVVSRFGCKQWGKIRKYPIISSTQRDYNRQVTAGIRVLIKPRTELTCSLGKKTNIQMRMKVPKTTKRHGTFTFGFCFTRPIFSREYSWSGRALRPQKTFGDFSEAGFFICRMPFLSPRQKCKSEICNDNV